MVGEDMYQEKFFEDADATEEEKKEFAKKWIRKLEQSKEQHTFLIDRFTVAEGMCDTCGGHSYGLSVKISKRHFRSNGLREKEKVTNYFTCKLCTTKLVSIAVKRKKNQGLTI